MSRTNQQEEIFESVESTPSFASNTVIELINEAEKKNELIDQRCFQVGEAFSYFASSAHKLEEYCISNKVEKRFESPWERYYRLKGELDDLENDIKSTTEEESYKNLLLFGTLQENVRRLSLQLSALGDDKNLQHPKDSSQRPDKLFQELIQQTESTIVRNSSAIKPSCIKDENVSDDLERRISRLETLLGYASSLVDNHNNATSLSQNPYAPTFPLLQTIIKLEEAVSFLNHQQIDNIRSKVTLLKLELETTLKSKTNLNELKLMELYKKVESFVDKVEHLDVISKDLPQLIVRLKTLETVHQQSALFAQRLQMLEKDVKSTKVELSSNRELIDELKSSLVNNLKVMQENVRMVEKRLSTTQNAP